MIQVVRSHPGVHSTTPEPLRLSSAWLACWLGLFALTLGIGLAVTLMGSPSEKSGDKEAKVRQAIEALEAESEANAAPTTELFEINADIGRLNECLQALDAPKRNSILAAYLDGCSHSEIAAKLNAPLGSVKAWIKRGLSSLRECME